MVVIIVTEVVRVWALQMSKSDIWVKRYWQIVEVVFLLITSLLQFISILMLIISIKKMKRAAIKAGDSSKLGNLNLNLCVGVLCLISFLIWTVSFEVILVLN